MKPWNEYTKKQLKKILSKKMLLSEQLVFADHDDSQDRKYNGEYETIHTFSCAELVCSYFGITEDELEENYDYWDNFFGETGLATSISSSDLSQERLTLETLRVIKLANKHLKKNKQWHEDIDSIEAVQSEMHEKADEYGYGSIELSSRDTVSGKVKTIYFDLSEI